MSDYLTAREAIYILRERLQEATPDEALQGSDFERRLQAASSDAPGAPITEFTYPDFMAWCPDGIHAEWIDGNNWLWQQPLPSIIDILLPDNGEEQPR